MFSNIFLNSKNLIYNVNLLSQEAKKSLCVMVKANAYGHGSKEIVSILKGKIKHFGVATLQEAMELREFTNDEIIVFGRCDDYEKCIENDISFILLSYNHANDMIYLSKKIKKIPQMHLCINTGMNRYGVKDKKEFLRIIELLSKNNIELKGIYTHFSSITTDREYTLSQEKMFEEFCSYLPKGWKTIRHVGGGKAIYLDVDADMYRVGIAAYGYGDDRLKPVLSVESEIVDIQNVSKGQHVGYLCGYTAQNDITVATIPLGYADGLPRKLSGKLKVKIKGKEAKSCGNICMDAFMVDVSNIKCKIGDKVVIMDNATPLASLLETTEYEVLTNMSKLRGWRVIK